MGIVTLYKPQVFKVENIDV